MGSFNTSCFVSQQTIGPGDAAYLFPIQQASSFNTVELIDKNGNIQEKYSFASSTCYPTAFWKSAGPMIEGEYDDYGRFSLTNNIANEKNIITLFNELFENSAKVNLGENEYHDLAFDISTQYDPKKKYHFKQLEQIWDYMWDVMQEHRVFIKKYSGDFFPFSFAVMHKITGDYLIEKISKSENWSGESNAPEELLMRTITKIVEDTKEIFSNRPIDSMLGFVANKVASLESMRIGNFEGNYIDSYYENIDSVYKLLKNNIFQNTICIDNKLIHSIMLEVQSLINHKYILSGLDSINAHFSPMVYASQDYQNEIGNEYTKLVLEVNKRVNLLIKEKYGDDDYAEESVEDLECNTTSKPKI